MHIELDDTDLEIIQLLQRNARMPIKDIAAHVYLSSPAVSNRIAHLEQLGVITGFHAEINQSILGYQIKAFINLEVEPAQKKVFYPFIKTCPNVVACSCVTGDYAMLIEVLFRTTIDLDTFIGTLQEYGRTKTQIVFSTCVKHRGISYS